LQHKEFGLDSASIGPLDCHGCAVAAQHYTGGTSLPPGPRGSVGYAGVRFCTGCGADRSGMPLRRRGHVRWNRCASAIYGQYPEVSHPIYYSCPMRIRAISVENIGGLVDQRIELPTEPLIAFAGPNGSGKTKLLAAMIGHWVNNIPAPREGETATSTIEVRLNESDRLALTRFQTEMGWSGYEIPENVSLIAHRSALAGSRRDSVPPAPSLQTFYDHSAFLQLSPGLNPMYLPAERRLLPASQAVIDLTQLADVANLAQIQSSRASIQNYGRLDDQEFEQFAKALCIASSLPDEAESESRNPISRIQWEEFVDTVNGLLHPKKLLPLTRSFPDQLRIQLPNGDTHTVPDLSSGERQALVIISRVMRAGAGHSVVLIDEPDAYLHPNLSQRLVEALRKGTGEHGQLILSTHSPAILDRISPSAIFRLDYERSARQLGSQSDLIDMYKNTGFRASALTQSEVLIVSEGDLDEVVLKALFPKLARASFSKGDGRANVVHRVKSLLEWDLPIIGMVDRDVNPPELDSTLEQHIVVLPTADIEGAFLSDRLALGIMVDQGFVKPPYSDVEALRMKLDELYAAQRENVIAEIAQAELRKTHGIKWPNSKGSDPIGRLRGIVDQKFNATEAEIEDAIVAATTVWELNKLEPWKIVRGKYILGSFASECTHWKSGSALLEGIAKQGPALSALAQVGKAVDRILD